MNVAVALVGEGEAVVAVVAVLVAARAGSAASVLLALAVVRRLFGSSAPSA